MLRKLTAAALLFFAFLCATPAGLVRAQQTAPARAEQQKEITVYITRTGKRYHRDRCRSLSRSRVPISLRDAKARGYTPCRVCHAPE